MPCQSEESRLAAARVCHHSTPTWPPPLKRGRYYSERARTALRAGRTRRRQMPFDGTVALPVPIPLRLPQRECANRLTRETTMLRVCAALAAALLVPGIAAAKELKPKFGNIDGVYYSDVSGNREACRQAIRNKIALCRQNTNFESNTKNRKYKGCLPIFKRQARSCVVHFRHQMSKCDLSGAARITDFTGFGCTGDEDGGRGRRRAGHRAAGPAHDGAHPRQPARRTGHGLPGRRVARDRPESAGHRPGRRLAAASQAPGGGTAFVHGNFMVASAGSQAPAQQNRGPAAGPSPKCAGMSARARNAGSNSPTSPAAMFSIR